MPQALQIDRELFRALVLQGFNAAQVASKLGMNTDTAHSWIRRMGLRATARKVKAELAQSGKQELAMAIAEDEAQRARKLVGKAIARDVAFLAEAPATRNAAQACKRYTQLAPLLAGAERVYAWRADDTAPATVSFSRLDVHVHHDAAPALDCQTVVSDTPATPSIESPAQVDATTTPVVDVPAPPGT